MEEKNKGERIQDLARKLALLGEQYGKSHTQKEKHELILKEEKLVRDFAEIFELSYDYN